MIPSEFEFEAKPASLHAAMVSVDQTPRSRGRSVRFDQRGEFGAELFQFTLNTARLDQDESRGSDQRPASLNIGQIFSPESRLTSLRAFNRLFVRVGEQRLLDSLAEAASR